VGSDKDTCRSWTGELRRMHALRRQAANAHHRREAVLQGTGLARETSGKGTNTEAGNNAAADVQPTLLDGCLARHSRRFSIKVAELISSAHLL